MVKLGEHIRVRDYFQALYAKLGRGDVRDVRDGTPSARTAVEKKTRKALIQRARLRADEAHLLDQFTDIIPH